MTVPDRSEHLTMYGMVGVAMHIVIGVLVAASVHVVPASGMIVLGILWTVGAIAGAVLWKHTVWIPLLSSLVVAGAWMTILFSNRST